ncbi:MAG: dockerin type I repeat-containing protein [Ruminococcus sp.]|nr:dockerin type I repeat-containing protein [Ruminococcus sp.]
MKRIFKTVLCLALVVMLLVSSTLCAFAANSKDAIIIYDINLTNVQTPYVGETPKYDVKLNTDAYYLDEQIDDDYDVINGQWWYDETTQSVVQPDETFIEGHVYTISILLCASDGYEFRVDEDNSPLVKATVNGETATIDEDYGKYRQFVEYTFEPCYENPIINEVELDVTEPVPGEYPDFYPELLTEGVTFGDSDSPYYIEGVAWYDYTTQTFMNFSDKFEEGHVYEINIVIEALGDTYFPTDVNDNCELVGYVNGNKATTETAGKNNKYYARICYAFGDKRREVSHVDVTGVTVPSVGATPDFTVADTAMYYINGVYWTDVTTSEHINLKETDVFLAGHTYELEVWLRTHDDYKFKTDSDGWIDITATVGGKNAEVVLPGAEIAAMLSVTYTLNAPQVVSFVDIGEVVEPIAGKTPDMEAYCYTNGCNVDEVSWYDITDSKAVKLDADSKFEAGRKYRVAVGVVAEGNTTFYMVDGYNEATGAINGEQANAFGSHDDKFVEFYYDFAPCKASDDIMLGDVDGDGKVSVVDATLVQRHVAKLTTLELTQLLAADTYKDGEITVVDATTIQRFVAKLITEF